MKLYGKKHNDIWYKGTLVEVDKTVEVLGFTDQSISQPRSSLGFNV